MAASSYHRQTKWTSSPPSSKNTQIQITWRLIALTCWVALVGFFKGATWWPQPSKDRLNVHWDVHKDGNSVSVPQLSSLDVWMTRFWKILKQVFENVGSSTKYEGWWSLQILWNIYNRHVILKYNFDSPYRNGGSRNVVTITTTKSFSPKQVEVE
jgi:hypothetical protein